MTHVWILTFSLGLLKKNYVRTHISTLFRSEVRITYSTSGVGRDCSSPHKWSKFPLRKETKET